MSVDNPLCSTIIWKSNRLEGNIDSLAFSLSACYRYDVRLLQEISPKGGSPFSSNALWHVHCSLLQRMPCGMSPIAQPSLTQNLQGYDAGIMTVILADDQFNEYYNMNAKRQGLVAIIPWAATALSQVWVRQRLLTDTPSF